MEELNRRGSLGLDLDEEESHDDTDVSDVQNSRTTHIARGTPRKRPSSRQTSESEYRSDDDEPGRGGDADSLNSTHILGASALCSNAHPIKSSSAQTSLPPPKSTSKRGVVYISRIPPYLKPHTLRQLISIHGAVTNLFLTPEPPAAYHHRVHLHHGNKKRQFIDGWVEFKHRRHAKACIDALNGRTTAEGLGAGAIGGRKGGKGRWYKDDVWSIKYLKGFSWEDLMHSARTEEREREERIRFGLVKEKKEQQAFLDSVSQAKIKKTRSKKRKWSDDHEENQGTVPRMSTEMPTDANHFQQIQAWSEYNDAEEGRGQVHRVLSKIF